MMRGAVLAAFLVALVTASPHDDPQHRKLLVVEQSGTPGSVPYGGENDGTTGGVDGNGLGDLPLDDPQMVRSGCGRSLAE